MKIIYHFVRGRVLFKVNYSLCFEFTTLRIKIIIKTAPEMQIKNYKIFREFVYCFENSEPGRFPLPYSKFLSSEHALEG